MTMDQALLQLLWTIHSQDQARAAERELVRSRPAPPPSSTPVLIDRMLEQDDERKQ